MKESRIRSIHEKLVRKDISARDVVDGYLSTIQKKDSDIHAFLDTYYDEARSHADAVDAKIRSGENIGLLEGVPIALKDNIVVQDKKTTAASKILAHYTASYDATVIKKLKEEGMIFVGKTNLDEFAMGASTENSAFGPTRNPHDLTRVPGGSSGGSAAAVAADMVPVALGSDTGGSIRQPAGFCGVVGFKPSYGRVSRYGLIAMASSLDQIGPFAHSVEDAEIILRAIEGKDSHDATSVAITEQVPAKKEYVIGVPREFFAQGLDAKIEEVIRASFAKAEGAKFRFQEITLPYISYALACYYVIVPAEVSSNLARFDGMRYGDRADAEKLFDVYKKTRHEGFGQEVKRRVAIGTYVLSHGYYDAYYVQAQKVRALIKHDFERAFRDVDVIAAPTSPGLPFAFGEKVNDPLSMYLEDVYTVPVNLAGLPALSLPAGRIGNLPVGVQLIGQYMRDYDLLAAAKSFEAAQG